MFTREREDARNLQTQDRCFSNLYRLFEERINFPPCYICEAAREGEREKERHDLS